MGRLDICWFSHAGGASKASRSGAKPGRLASSRGVHRAFTRNLSVLLAPAGRIAQALGHGIRGLPALTIGGEKSFGANEASVMRNVATNVTELVMPSTGHWLMEEATAPTTAAVRKFLTIP